MRSHDAAAISAVPLINSLCSADAYSHPIAPVQLKETHISWVLLTGEYAYKIKKPVDFGFLDFSTLDKRKFYCEEELRLNQRLAGDWYLQVVPITGHAKCPKMAGSGLAIEYAVKMRQFPSVQTLNDLAQNKQLSISEIDQIVEIVAGFHQQIDKADGHSPYGDSNDIKHWMDENFECIRPYLKESHHLAQLAEIADWSKDEWLKISDTMTQRKLEGHVRECHGDLHLGNMTLIAGKVTLFDCIEFNPLLRWIDVISEAAFVVMDLLHLGYGRFAYRFLNRYLQFTGDYEGLRVLRYYLVYRAMVRAKVSAIRKAQQLSDKISHQADLDYDVFVSLSRRFTLNRAKVLMITHGFSGSGKSTIAGQLAEVIGAVQIRSDIERKRLFGFAQQESSMSSRDGGIYTQEAGAKTYRRLAELAKVALESGFPVIIDAAFLKYETRVTFRQLAAECGVDFVIIDFDAKQETLFERIRQRQNDPSEATVDVLWQQLQTAQVLTEDEKSTAIIVDTEAGEPLAGLLGDLKKRLLSITGFNS